MLTGGLPFGRDGPFNEYAERVVNEAPELVTVRCPEAPPRLAGLIHDLLAPWRRRCIWARGRIGTLPTTYVGATFPGHCW